MKITLDEVHRFQALWKEEFLEELPEEEARLVIGRLDALYLELARP